MTCSIHSPNLTFVLFNTPAKWGVDDRKDKRICLDLKEALRSNVSGNRTLKKVIDISEDTPSS